MERGKIEARTRADRGRRPARRLRREGRVPAVLYGRGAECVALSIEKKPLEAVLRGHRHLVEIDLEGLAEPALIQEVQWDPLGEHVEHVDFLRVSLDAEVEIEVNLHLVGQAKGLKDGGMLEQHASHLRLRALPRLLPDVLRVDVSGVDLNQHLTAGEVPLPAGVSVVGDLGQALVSVVAKVAAAEPVAGEGEEQPAEPEVIGKGRKTGDEEGEEEGKSQD